MNTIDHDDREVLRRRALDRIAECREWNATANPPLVALKSDRVTVSAGDLLGLLETLRRAEARIQVVRQLATQEDEYGDWVVTRAAVLRALDGDG